MDRNRETRRLTMAAATNGLSRRRHRASNLRYSPEDDAPFESPEMSRLRDRGASLKKDRDRERDREREKDRERDRFSSRKRRAGEKLMMHGNRDDGIDDSSEESISVEEEEETADDGGGGGPFSSAKMLPPSNSNRSPFSSSSLASHPNSSGSLQHRKSFPPPTKVVRATVTSAVASPVAPTWKAADEMIGVSVPRKARSASAKRSHEPWSSGATGVVFASSEQIDGQRSMSPARASPASLLTSSSTPAPTSPSSSSASVRKKMPMGQKQRPPKSTFSKPSSAPAENDIEIEIAEVLYDMMRQPSVPTKQETLGNDSTVLDSNEVRNKSTNEAKSRVSSPISNSQYTVPQPSSIMAANSSSANVPVSAIAPKRKRPRPVKYEEEKNNAVLTSRYSSMPSTSSSEIDISAKIEACHKENKISGSKVENCSRLESSSQAASQTQHETDMRALNPTFDLNPLVEEDSQRRDANPSSIDEFSSGMKLENNGLENTATKVTSPAPEKENRREENYKIDLMAPARSPERENEMNRVAAENNMKVVDVETEARFFFKKTDKAEKISCKEELNLENQGKKMKMTVEAESRNQEMNIDLKFDLEKCDREDGSSAANGNKVSHLNQKQPHLQQPNAEKTAQVNALPPHMSIPGWPGALPPMGYMAPLQGVVSMDGSTSSSATMQPPHMVFNQPRPKRCATHCYIAKNIHYHQQFTKMNPFWHAAAGSAPIYGGQPCNLSLMPPSEIQANTSAQVSHSSLDKNSHSTSSGVDNSAQRKQILLQQALPPGATTNIMHGPAFIFPLSQQPQAASVRPVMAGNTASGTGTSTSVSANGSAAATPVGATTMSFSYPNLPGNETQYLAILQNNAYPFPVPAHVGAPPGYRGAPGQAMPFFNSQFYPSQMLHPSHLQPQQQQLQLSQAQQNQMHGNQNLSNSTAPAGTQKQPQSQQQRSGNSSGTLQGFPAPKNQSHPSNFQQRQNTHHQSEIVGEDGPSTADNRVSRCNVTYGPNNTMPMQAPNFGITSSSAPNGSKSSHVEKKLQQSSKAGVEAFTSQPFAMSFSTMNGVTSAAAPGINISSTAQNHAMFHSLPEAARQGYQMMAAAVAAQAAQQKMNFRASEDGKPDSKDGSNAAEERKSLEKTTTHTGQSIAFSRPDVSNTAVSAVTANNVIDSSAWLLNLGSAPPRLSNGSSMPPAHPQMLRSQQQQQQQILQLQKQQQYAAAAAAASTARSKVPVSSNGTVFSDHGIASPSVAAAKLPNNLTGFSHNIVQSSGGPGQSPRWKNNNSSRMSTSQVSSPSMSSSSNPSSLKNVTQKMQIRSQQAQISFAANSKSSPSAEVQQALNSNQAPSPPVLAGSPSTSSLSKSAGGSPRTTASTSTSNKPGQASSSLSSQPVKNSPSSSGPNQLQSGGRNVVASVLGNPTAVATGTKPQSSHQQPQQPPKHALQQAQLFFSGAYMQTQQQHSSNNINVSPAGGYYLQRHQPQTGSSTTSSSLTNSVTCDPAKAIAAAAASNNQKQGPPHSSGSYVSATQTAGKTHQLVPPGFPYVHAVPTAVQAKPADQKQTGGE